MTAQWEYWTGVVKLAETRKSTPRKSNYDWVVVVSGGQWDGWQEVFNNLGNEGWEIFSIVVSDQQGTQVDFASGYVAGYRIFAKKPK